MFDLVKAALKTETRLHNNRRNKRGRGENSLPSHKHRTPSNSHIPRRNTNTTIPKTNLRPNKRPKNTARRTKHNHIPIKNRAGRKIHKKSHNSKRDTGIQPRNRETTIPTHLHIRPRQRQTRLHWNEHATRKQKYYPYRG